MSSIFRTTLQVLHSASYGSKCVLTFYRKNQPQMQENIKQLYLTESTATKAYRIAIQHFSAKSPQDKALLKYLFGDSDYNQFELERMDCQTVFGMEIGGNRDLVCSTKAPYSPLLQPSSRILAIIDSSSDCTMYELKKEDPLGIALSNSSFQCVAVKGGDFTYPITFVKLPAEIGDRPLTILTNNDKTIKP